MPSPTVCQGISKEQKQNFDVCQTEYRGRKRGRLPRKIEKAKNKRTIGVISNSQEKQKMKSFFKFDTIFNTVYSNTMDTKNLTIRVDKALYNRLNTLKKVVKVSINQLVCEAVDKYVAERSMLAAQELQDMAKQLRSYRDSDPNLKKSLQSFAKSEGHYQDDPLEGEVVDTAIPHTKLQELLNG